MTRLRRSAFISAAALALAVPLLSTVPSQAAGGCNWSQPQRISTGTFDALPSVASGKAGLPAIAYYDFGDRTRALVSDLISTTNLGRVSSQPNPQMRPQLLGLAQNAKGQAVATFTLRTGNEMAVFAARRSASGGWEPRQQLTRAGEFGMYPQVAIDATGRAIAVWTQSVSSGGSYIYGRAIGPKGGLGALFRLGNGQSENPVVAVGASGLTYVAWDEVGINANPVWAAQSTNGGKDWTDATLVSSPRAAIDNLAVAVAGSGRAALVWDQEEGGISDAVQVTAASTKRDNVWIAPVSITRGNHLSMNAGVATGGTNEFTVAWISTTPDGSPGKSIVKVSSGSRMDALDGEVVLDRTNENLWMTRAHVAVNATGVAAVAWERNWSDSGSHAGDRAGIMGAVRQAGVWQPNQLLRGWRADPGYSRLGVDTAGVVTVAWDEGQGDSGSIGVTQCAAGPNTQG